MPSKSPSFKYFSTISKTFKPNSNTFSGSIEPASLSTSAGWKPNSVFTFKPLSLALLASSKVFLRVFSYPSRVGSRS